jgi:hypothetical protein
VCFSPSGALRAVARDLTKPGAAKPTNYLELWSETNGRIEAVFDLSSRKAHGPIYEDGTFQIHFNPQINTVFCFFFFL